MASYDLSSKVAIVTGASSGMGAEIARELARCGAAVVLVGRDKARLADVHQSIAEVGGSAHSVRVDITEPSAPQSVVDQALDAFGRLTTLVNAAGIFEYGAVSLESVASLDRQWSTNVRAPLGMTVASLPHLAQGASVIFISSVAGQVGIDGGAAYSATKGAVEALIRSLAVELAPKGLRVNGIAPGEIDTPMNATLYAEDPGYVETIIAQTPARRLGTVKDIAPVAAFLASDDSKFIQGVSVAVDGGLTSQ